MTSLLSLSSSDDVRGNAGRPDLWRRLALGSCSSGARASR